MKEIEEKIKEFITEDLYGKTVKYSNQEVVIKEFVAPIDLRENNEGTFIFSTMARGAVKKKDGELLQTYPINGTISCIINDVQMEISRITIQKI